MAGQRISEILAVKAAARERDGGCTACGITNEQHRAEHGRQLDVHRLVPGSPYTLAGVVAICRGCHGSQPKRVRWQPDLAYDKANLNVWVRKDLADALRLYLKSLRPRVSKQAIIEMILEEFLVKLKQKAG